MPPVAGREDPAAFLSLMASGVIWGLTWWPLKFFAAAGLTSYTIALTAYGLVGAASLPVIWRQRARWRPQWRALLLIGLCFGCTNLAFNAAIMSGSVVRAMLLFYLLPAWGAIGGCVFLNERLGPRRMVAVASSLTGVAVILSHADVWREAFSYADVMALGAGLAYTATGIANRRAPGIPLASRTLISFVGSAVLAASGMLLLPVALPTLPAATWALLGLFAFVWMLGGTLMTTYGVTHVQAGRAAVLQVVELLVAVGSAVLLGGESLSPQDYIGGVLILAATLIEARNAE